MCELLGRLLARECNLVCIDDDDEVTHIHVRSEGRLVLAAKKYCCVGCYATQYNAFSIDDVPLWLRIARLWTKCTHALALVPLQFLVLAH